MPRTVLVTGANRGLGLEFVRQLAARGDHVIATARRPGEAPELMDLANEVLPLDVMDGRSIDALASAVRGRPIDVLINNAGVMGNDKSIADATLEEVSRVLITNSASPAAVTRALLPNLRAGGEKKIVNISSTLGSIAGTFHGFSYAYCASKAALNMISAKLAKELGKEGFVCVSFCPGWNKTDMGGAGAPLEPKDSIASLLGVMDRLTKADSGKFLSHEGKPIAW